MGIDGVKPRVELSGTGAEWLREGALSACWPARIPTTDPGAGSGGKRGNRHYGFCHGIKGVSLVSFEYYAFDSRWDRSSCRETGVPDTACRAHLHHVEGGTRRLSASTTRGARPGSSTCFRMPHLPELESSDSNKCSNKSTNLQSNRP
jgi:hypothetical protein